MLIAFIWNAFIEFILVCCLPGFWADFPNVELLCGRWASRARGCSLLTVGSTTCPRTAWEAGADLSTAVMAGSSQQRTTPLGEKHCPSPALRPETRWAWREAGGLWLIKGIVYKDASLLSPLPATVPGFFSVLSSTSYLWGLSDSFFWSYNKFVATSCRTLMPLSLLAFQLFANDTCEIILRIPITK